MHDKFPWQKPIHRVFGKSKQWLEKHLRTDNRKIVTNRKEKDGGSHKKIENFCFVVES